MQSSNRNKQRQFQKQKGKNEETQGSTAPTTGSLRKSNFPSTLAIKYQHSNLIFDWTCNDLQEQKSISSRHILMFDFHSYKKIEDILQLIEEYYKRMALGDFLKVIFIGASIKKKWVERTGTKIDLEAYNEPKKSSSGQLIKLCKYVFQDASKYSQPTIISILSPHFQKISKETLQQILEQKKKFNFTYVFNFFIPVDEVNNQFKNHPQIITLYDCCTQQMFIYSLKCFFRELIKIKIVHAQLKLTCHNAQLQLSEKNRSWTKVQKNLVRNFYAVSSTKCYVQELELKNLLKVKLSFHLQFTIKLLNGNIFRMVQNFSIESENEKNQKIMNQSILKSLPFKQQKHKQMMPYSELQKVQQRNNRQRVIIKQRIPSPETPFD